MALSDDDYDFDDVLGKADFDANQWKIAYADFTTSMMAILFVLWVIASGDTQTREHLAKYFNPVGIDYSQTSGGQGLLGDEATSRGDIINLQNGSQRANTSSSLIPMEVQEQSDIQTHMHNTMQAAGIDAYSETLSIAVQGNQVYVVLQSTDKYPLFTSDNKVAPRLKAMLKGLSPVIENVGRPFDLEAHQATPPAPMKSKRSLHNTQAQLAAVLEALPVLSFPQPQALKAYGASQPAGHDSTHYLNDRLVIVIK